MIKTGTLPSGIKVNGQTYREYELREQIVADEVEIMESEHGPRAMKSDAFFNVCVMARRITFKGLAEPVTPDMVMGMVSGDFSRIMRSGKEQEAERDSFRGAAEAASDAGVGTPQAGV